MPKEREVILGMSFLKISNRFYRRFICGALCSVILSAGISSVAFSYSWFSNKNHIENNKITGSTAGAYFARGDGTETNPYVINLPIHLYNLAWLQDMGYFDSKETYFIIEADFDMSGWILPPIGTTEHPFIGHLDGFDETYSKDQSTTAVISNLTISNNFNDFPRKPSKATSSTVSNAYEVGFFGTFGKEKETYEDGKEPTAKNLYLDNLQVKSSSSNTLVGMVAGYVNGSVDSIGVSDSTVTVASSSSSYGGYTSNISDYTTIGYTEDKYKVDAYEKKISTKASDLSFSQESEGSGGSAAGNGGSIDMNQMYKNLLEIWKTNESHKVQVETAETITYDINGNVVDDQVTAPEDFPTTSFSSIDYYLANQEQKYNGRVSSSYSFARRTNTNDYILLYGREKGTISSKTKTVTETRPTKFYYKTISDSTGSNYLSVSNGYVANANTGTSNYWFFDGNLLSFETNGSTYYLRDNSGTLTVTTSKSYATNLTYNQEGSTYVSDDGYYLIYDSGWSLKQIQYKVSGSYNGNTYYLTNSGTSLTTTSTKSSAAEWLLDGSNRLYTTINGKTYYLVYSEYGWEYSPSLTENTVDALTYDSSSNTFSVRISGWFSSNTYYLYLTSNGVSLNTSSKTTFDLIDNVNGGLTIKDDQSTETIGDVTKQYTADATYETNPTYFPISGSSGIPDENNTGYVISGAYNSNNTLGDIRVSLFDKYGSWRSKAGLQNSGISSSSNTLTTVRTINNSGDTTVTESDFDHYTETKTKFEEILKNSYTSSQVAGLHFMDATISKDHLVSLDYARIGDKEYIDEGYELPEDSIDFNLLRKGYVNFFAGTYFVNGLGGVTNNTFFSFHEVEREGTKIKNIREIEEIYKNPSARQSQSYVYKYSDNTYSVPFLHGTKTGVKYDLDGNPLTNDTPTDKIPSGYTEKVFDTTWIKATNATLQNYYAYYFEIPCNAGEEYALGSVTGKTGAYLDYLDIGANAQRTDVTQVTELKEMSTYVYSYPKGVSFSFISDDSSVALPAIDAKNNASFSLGSSFSGDMSVSRTDSTSTDSTTTEFTSQIEYTTSSSSAVTTEYKYRAVDVKGNGTAISEATGVITEKIEINSITKYSYSLFAEEATKTEYRKTKTTSYSSGVESSSSSSSEVYVNDVVDSTAEMPVDLVWTFTEKYTSKTYVYYLESTSVTITVATNLVENYSSDDGTYYYKLGGYNISYTSDVDLEIELISLSDDTLTIKVITGEGETDYTILTLSTPQTFTKNA